MITGYIIERCEDGTDKWLRCNARLCPDLFYKVLGKKDNVITVVIQYIYCIERHQNYFASVQR